MLRLGGTIVMYPFAEPIRPNTFKAFEAIPSAERVIQGDTEFEAESAHEACPVNDFSGSAGIRYIAIFPMQKECFWSQTDIGISISWVDQFGEPPARKSFIKNERNAMHTTLNHSKGISTTCYLKEKYDEQTYPFHGQNYRHSYWN
jgi:hypothetical protein